MQFGVGVGAAGEPLAVSVERARRVEAAGLDFVCYGDSQIVLRDVFCALSAFSGATRNVKLGTMVTNPVTRLPIVLANAIATVDDLSKGRAFMAIGGGGSAVANAAVRRAGTAQLADALLSIRSAFRDAPGLVLSDEDFDRSVAPIAWASRKVPLIVHAAGPRAFEVATSLGDAVLLRFGDIETERLPARLIELRATRERGARAGLPFEIWLYAPLFVHPDAGVARASLGGIVSARAVTMKRAEIPPEYLEAFDQYLAGYQYRYHTSLTEPYNLELMERLGLADYMFRRYALTGDESAVVARIRMLQAAGLDALATSVMVPDPDACIDAFGAIAMRCR